MRCMQLSSDIFPSEFLTYATRDTCYNLLLTYSVEQSPSWEANRFSASQRNSPNFMEPEGSLPHPQVSVTCPYREPDRSSLCPPLIPLPENPS